MKAKTVQQILAEAEELLRTDSFSEALKRLQSCSSLAMTRGDRGYFCILIAESSLYLGKYEIDAVLDEAVEIFRLGKNTGLFGRAKFLKGWLFSARGDYLPAKEALTEAYSHFGRLEDFGGMARVLNRLAYALFKSGNVHTAISNLNKCAELYRRLQDNESELHVRVNACYLEWSIGRLRASCRSYAAISNLLGDSTDRRKLIYHEMYAVPLSLVGRLPEARLQLAKALPLLDVAVREKAIYYENLGLIEILSGNYAKAEEALSTGLEISLEIAPESALVSQIKRLFGDLCVATEKWDKAENFAVEALAVAEKINERIEIAACWRVLAQVALHRGDMEKARELYVKTIDLFSLIGAQYELAVTRYLAGTSGLWSNGERMAMLYLAREYFASEEVKPYLEKADHALNTYTTKPKQRRTIDCGDNRLVAKADSTQRIKALAEHVAESSMNILLTGETGTGKDLFARYIHECSGRKGPFVPVNVAALPSDMIEAELFGHAKGAFTGAAADRKGLIEEAADGTLYLNEIGEAPAHVQVKLLEVLETRRIRRIGENGYHDVSFRLIAATNRDLQQAIREDRFRLDLFHRLNEIAIHLPPLRDRREDIPALVEHFLATEATNLISNGSRSHIDALLSAMSGCYWSGNVRELRAMLLRVAYQSAGDFDRMIELAREETSRLNDTALEHAMLEADGNQSEAARMLGVSEGSIRYRLKKSKDRS